MTGTQILAQAELNAEDLEIDETQGLALINECLLQDIGLDAGIITSQVIDASADTWHTLDDTIVDIFEITLAGSTTPYYGSMYGELYEGIFDIRDNMIRFPAAGTYTIYGKCLPDPMTSLSQIPSVNALWHYPISVYVAFRGLWIEDEDDVTAPKLQAKYFAMKEDVMSRLDTLKPTTRRPPVMKRRAWY